MLYCLNKLYEALPFPHTPSASTATPRRKTAIRKSPKITLQKNVSSAIPRKKVESRVCAATSITSIFHMRVTPKLT